MRGRSRFNDLSCCGGGHRGQATGSKTERAANIFSATGLAALLRRFPVWSGVLVLNYHRIGDPAATTLDRGVFSTTSDEFAGHMALIARHFDVVAAEQLADARGRRGRHVLVTFDDGYRDNYEEALPALESHGIPATFFITTGFIDRPRLAWWDEISWMVRTSERARLEPTPRLPAPVELNGGDREPAVRQLLGAAKRLHPDEIDPFLDEVAAATGGGRAPSTAADGVWMTWDMIRDMRRRGMTIGGHTVSHPLLGRLSAERQAAEIGQCLGRIDAEVGERPMAFSYPEGGPDAMNRETRACLEAEGVEIAFVFRGRYRRRRDPWDALAIPRSAVSARMSPRHVAAKVTLPQVFARW